MIYCVVMGSEDEGQFQVWVLIYNDMDEDWNLVMIELVNGCLSFFVYFLVNLLYVECELVDILDGLSMVLQIVFEVWGGFVGFLYGVGGLGLLGLG